MQELEIARVLADASARAMGGDVDGAVELYDRVVAQAPKNGDAWRGKALALAGAGRYAESLIVLSHGVRAAPDDDRMAGLYIGLTAPIMVTDPASAETIKYASNAFLATKISFVNAVAAVCEAVGADVNDVVLGMGYDRRIGQEFLTPGPGWGGSCFPKDTLALVHIAEQAGYDFRLLKGVVDVNNEQFERVVRKVVAAVGGDVAGRHIAAWGLTFKARTDDTRMSPAIEVIKRLQALGAEVTAYDPAIRMDIEGITVAPDAITACKGAELLMVLTEWDEFKWVDLDEVGQQMTNRRLVDTRNLLDRSRAQVSGFEYQGIGRS